MFEIKQEPGGSTSAPPLQREASPPPARFDAAFEPSSRPPAAPLKIVSVPRIAACRPPKTPWPVPEEEEEEDLFNPAPIASPDASPPETSEEEGDEHGHDEPQRAPGWGPVRLSNAAAGDLLFEHFEDRRQQ